MRRLNFLDDKPWDEIDDEYRTRVRWFGHPFETDMLGASLIELLPGASGGPLQMHYGVEEMFFVLAGRPTVRTPEGDERLAPGDVIYFPEGPDGLHDFSNPAGEPARLLGISTKRFPDIVASPERGVARAIPSGRYAKASTRASSPASTCRPSSRCGLARQPPSRSASTPPPQVPA